MRALSETYKRSPLPLYLQVATALRRRIDTGHWAPGAQISTLEELEAEFQVARVTVRQAVEVLQNEGLVQRRQGKGTFVSKTIKDRRWLRLETEWSELISTIEDNVPTFMPVPEPLPPRLSDNDGIAADKYEYLRSVQSREGEPFALAGVHIDCRIYKRAPRMFQTRTALPVLVGLKGIKISRAHQTLVIGTADAETAALLRIPLNAPTAEARCVVTDDAGIVIYVADIIYRGDCVKLDIDLFDGEKH